MAKPGSANIRSPEVLERFRQRFINFEEQVRSGVDLVSGDLRSVQEWLHREQLPGWRRELRRRHDELKLAWREYLNARYGDRRMGKPSSVDERKAYERARRRKLEAEERIQVVERWIVSLEQRAAKLTPAVKRLGSILDLLVPKAVARLDQMLMSLEDYLRPSARSPGAGGGQKDGGEMTEGEDA